MTPFGEGLEMGRCSGGLAGYRDGFGSLPEFPPSFPFPPAAPFFHGITRAQQLLLQCHPSLIIPGICNSAESHEGGEGERPEADAVPASQPRCSITPSLTGRLPIAQTWPFYCYLCHASPRRLRSKPSIRLAGVPTPALWEEAG